MAPLTLRRCGLSFHPFVGIPLMVMLWMSACAPASLHIAPAHKGMHRNEVSFLDHASVPVINGQKMLLKKVDGVPVGSFFHVYLSPGWHFFEYGFRVYAGCRKYKHTKVFVDYGVGVLRDPRRDRFTCLDPIMRDSIYSGWFLLGRGDRHRWVDIQPLLKRLPETGGPSPYDTTVPGVFPEKTTD